MSTAAVVIVIILSFLLGAILSWILAKSRSSNTISELKKEVTILSAQHSFSENTINELRATIQDFKSEIDGARMELKSLVEAKTQAETLLKNASQQISDLQKRENSLNDDYENLQRKLIDVKEENAGLDAKHEETLKRLEEQKEFIDRANVQLREAFNSLSAEALKKNNESFVTLAKSSFETQVTDAKGDLEKRQQAIDALVKPLAESLGKFDAKIHDLEKVRLEQHGQINEYMQGVRQTTEKLEKETHSLVTALKTSHGRGRYGEIALRRVVEVAGMTEHCDFEEQVTVANEDGVMRPDLVVHLPERKTIVVDSKVPLIAYMKAFETEDENERKAFLEQHAIAVRDHFKKLSVKAYWSQFVDSPDYVILYMQIESSFAAALQTDPTLVEDGIRNKIIFATPTTLITLLRTAGFVWQQVKIAENIEQIRDAGIELYNRTTVLLRHFSNMGSSLKTAVTHYNNAVASLESRFVPQAKKLYALGSAYTNNVLPETEQIELNVREIASQIEPKDEV